MTSVILKHIGAKWQLIEPFGRAERKTIDDLRDGEKENDICKDLMHVVTWDGDPPGIVKLTQDELASLRLDPSGFRDNKDLYRSKCFLWVITAEALIIVKEKVRNVRRTHDPNYICHTNITCGEAAYIAGEVLFGEDGRAYLNNFSDRYGGRNTPPELWEAAKTVFKELGYTEIVDFFEII